MMPLLRRISLVLVLLSVTLVTGCTARYIRDAQDHFNTAAETENRLAARAHSSFDAGLNATAQSTALAEYKLALSLLRKAIDENEGKLREEGLLGTAYMLEAMSLWRISDLEQDVPAAGGSDPRRDELKSLLERINSLSNAGKIRLGTRDKVLLKALPGLLDHDRGRTASNFQQAERMFESAFVVLGSSLQGVPQGHPVQVYVRMAQLQTLIAWRSKVHALVEDPQEKTEKKKQIRRRVSSVVCPLKPKWEGNKKVQDELTDFLRPMGISWSTATAHCS